MKIAFGNPGDPNVHSLLDELSASLTHITGRDGRESFSLEDVQVPRSVFLVAADDSGLIGCGAIRPLQDDICEIKRMYARAKGSGVGSAILQELEKHAFSFGYKKALLETGFQNQKAINFYLKHGYSIRENFGKYQGRPECVCFEKELS